jgi:hypothetical protein
MSGLFSGIDKARRKQHAPVRRIFGRDQPDPEAPPIAEAPTTPTTDDARAIEEEQMRLRRRKGFASTFLTRMFGRPGVNSSSATLGAGGAAPAGTGLDAPKPVRRSGAPTYKQP